MNVWLCRQLDTHNKMPDIAVGQAGALAQTAAQLDKTKDSFILITTLQ